MKMLTVQVVAQRLDISASSVYRMISGGEIAAVRVTGKAGLRVCASEFDEYLKKISQFSQFSQFSQKQQTE